MKYRPVIPSLLLCALLFALLSGCGVGETKPFTDLKAEDIASADIYLVPPGSTITIADDDGLSKLTDLLNDVVLYEQDDAGRDMDGQLVEITIVMANGTTHSISAYGDYMYYDGVCYKAKYEPSEALNAFGNSYYKELPDRGTPPEESETGLVGIVRTPATEVYEDPWGVKLTAKNITPKGLTLVCKQQDGEPAGELQTGSPYSLEVYKDGEWIAVEMLPMENDLAWTEEAWRIPSNDTVEWTVDWSWLYGELPAGVYRISKSVMDFRGTGDYEEKTYYAGFELIPLEKGEPLTISCLHDGVYVSIPYVAGWEYSIDEYTDGCTSWGVSFRPMSEDGSIKLHYWDSFGVCGSGLEEHEITLTNGLTAFQGTYDYHSVWDYISIRMDEGNVVAMTESVDAWWPKYEDAAMDILGACEIESVPD